MTAALRRHLRLFQRLPVFEGTRLETGKVRLKVRHVEVTPWAGEAAPDCDGDDSDDSEIIVFVLPGSRLPAASATLLHELVHASGLWGHDRRFRTRLVVAMTQAFPEVPVPARVQRRLASLPMLVLDEVITVAAAYALWRRGEVPGITVLGDFVIAGLTACRWRTT